MVWTEACGMLRRGDGVSGKDGKESYSAQSGEEGIWAGQGIQAWEAVRGAVCGWLTFADLGTWEII